MQSTVKAAQKDGQIAMRNGPTLQCWSLLRTGTDSSNIMWVGLHMCVLELSCKLDGSMTNPNHGTMYVAHQRLITVAASRTKYLHSSNHWRVVLFFCFPHSLHSLRSKVKRLKISVVTIKLLTTQDSWSKFWPEVTAVTIESMGVTPPCLWGCYIHVYTSTIVWTPDPSS